MTGGLPLLLIVDDNLVDRQRVRRMLGDGFRFVEAGSATQALEIVKTAAPAALLLDYRLPDQDGLDVLPRIIEHAVPVIMLTGDGGEEIAVEALKGGAVDYLAKDRLTDAVLRRAVTQAIETSRLKQAVQDLEERVQQAQKMEAVGRLAGGVAHDFNNLLTVIFTFGQFVNETLEAGSSAAEDMAEVLEAADRARALTRQLLAFSRKQPVTPEAVNVPAMIEGLRRMLTGILGEEITLEIEHERESACALIDPLVFEQVVFNLCLNARDAMPSGGRLRIRTSRLDAAQHAKLPLDESEGDYVLITVADTGEGMDEHTQAHAFEPFFTTKPVDRGTGLGLSTCFGIVRQAGGHMWLESEVGRGTSMMVALPETSQMPAALESNTAPHHEGSATLLVVEDDERLRAVVARILKKDHHTVHLAGSGREGLVQAGVLGDDIDLVLTDVVMPDMGGKALADELAKSHPNVPLIFMSGYAENELAHQGILPEGTNLIEKPFTPEELLARVRDALRQGAQR